MTYINWSPNKQFYVDTSDLSIYAPGDYPKDASVIGLPTYGRYGGPLLSAGSFDELPPLSATEFTKKTQPVDLVDTAFWEHDRAVFLADDPAARLQADIELLQDLAVLSPQLTDPEAMVYAGVATLYFALTTPLDPEIAAAFTAGALISITEGLEDLPQRDVVKATKWAAETIEVVTSDNVDNALDDALDALAGLLSAPVPGAPDNIVFSADTLTFTNGDAKHPTVDFLQHIPEFAGDLPASVLPDGGLPEAAAHGIEQAREHLPEHVSDHWLLS